MTVRTGASRIVGRFPATTAGALSGGTLPVVLHFVPGIEFDDPLSPLLASYAAPHDLLRPPIGTAIAACLVASVVAGTLSFVAVNRLADGYRTRHALGVAGGYVVAPGLVVGAANAAIGAKILGLSIARGSPGGVLVGVFLATVYLFFGVVSGVATAVVAVPGGAVAGSVGLAVHHAYRIGRG